MLKKWTKGYLKDKLIKSSRGRSLIREYESLKKWGWYYSRNDVYIKRGEKLFKLEKKYEYATRKSLIAKYWDKEANRMMSNWGSYYFPEKLPEETITKLKSYMIQILSSGSFMVYCDTAKPSSTKFWGSFPYAIYNPKNEEVIEKTKINLSSYFESNWITAKKLLENSVYSSNRELEALARVMSGWNLPYQMKQFIFSELQRNTDNKYWKVLGWHYDKKTEELLNEILKEIVVYKYHTDKYTEVPSKYDEEIVKLIDVADWTKLTASELWKFIDKNPTYEKALQTHSHNTTPKRYRKILAATYRAQTKDIMRKIAKGDLDPEMVVINEKPKDASRFR